jgi:carbon-monoxide dehydrogenase medium subunit
MSHYNLQSYHSPSDLKSALQLLNNTEESIKIVAGGQSVMLLLRQGFLSPDAFLDVSCIPELSGVSLDKNKISIGAATTYSSLELSKELQSYSILLDALHVIADPQIRNLGTIGGALGHADPSLDIVPPLLCLDSKITLKSLNNTRTISLLDFHKEYMTADLSKDELIHSITFDHVTKNQGGAYEKVSNVEGGWPTVGVAAQVELNSESDVLLNVKIALAAVGDTAIRSNSMEKNLIGSEISIDSIKEASELVSQDIDPIDDLSGSAKYKSHLAGVLSQRALRKAIQRAGGNL